VQKGGKSLREFDYTAVPNELMNHELMNLVSAIHEYKGKQELFIKAKPDVLTNNCLMRTY